MKPGQTYKYKSGYEQFAKYEGEKDGKYCFSFGDTKISFRTLPADIQEVSAEEFERKELKYLRDKADAMQRYGTH